VSIQDFSFRPDSGVLLSSIERYPDEGKQTERSYDEKGLLAAEVTTAAGKVLDTIAYVRNDKGWMTTKTRRGPLGLEVWRYSLDDSGKVMREAYSVGGSLARMTVYGEGKLRTEELYKEGEVFLKIFYDGDTRLREEVFVDGVIVQERRY
jgi:antitoxin component YwqK of YwqJK toxin-antitoxin module